MHLLPTKEHKQLKHVDANEIEFPNFVKKNSVLAPAYYGISAKIRAPRPVSGNW